MMRSSVCCGAKLAMDASGVLESLSVSRVSCVCTCAVKVVSESERTRV